MAKRKQKQKGRGGGKANPLGLPEIGPTRDRGRFGGVLQRHKTAEDRDPRIPNFTARCRTLGLKPKDHNLVTVNVPYLGSDLGRVLHHEGMAHPDIMRLWQYWHTFCQVQRTYRSRILGISAEPKGTSVLMVAERIEAHPEDEPDIRTEEERDHDARAAWVRWNRILDGGMDPSLRVALYAAERGEGPPLWHEHAPTFAGHQAANALRLLADLAER